MSQEMKCPKCGGEMREGELFISITGSTPTQTVTALGFPTGSTIGISMPVLGEGPFWRERTEEKKGWLVKRSGTQTLKVSGLRCTTCRYIELYVCE